MAIHRAARAFDSVADVYERARPGFPPEAVDALCARLGIRTGTAVLDLGAGTGKLARLLAARGARVVAVEPLAAMRAKLAEVAPEVEALEGTAEAIPLPDASVEAVAVAQAFHWFRGEEALAEIHRVLRPGGGLGLVWNRRDMSAPIHVAFECAISAHRGDAPAHGSGAWRLAFEAGDLFGPLEPATFPNLHHVDRHGIVARAASISFVAALPEEERAAVLREVARIAPDPPATVAFPYVTEVYVTRRR